MDVMKGVDPTLPESSSSASAAKRDKAAVKPSRKGKERSVEPDQEDVGEADDDAAWMAKRVATLPAAGTEEEEGTMQTVRSL